MVKYKKNEFFHIHFYTNRSDFGSDCDPNFKKNIKILCVPVYIVYV